MKTERELSLDLLVRAEREGLSFSEELQLILHEVSKDAAFKKRFFRALADGTYRYLPRLDYVLNLYSHTKTHQMKPLIRNLLRMSVFQILFLDEVPDAIACDEAVKLAQKRGFAPLKGFVNGVLRTVCREKEAIPYPDADAKDYLSVRYAMPEVLSMFFTDTYGCEKAEAICAASLEVRPVCIRLREHRMRADGVTKEALWDKLLEKEGLQAVPHGTAEGVWTLRRTGDVTALYGFREGYFAVQDAASVLAVRSAGIRRGDTVMDVCASPGGKTAAAADACGEEGHVLAWDISQAKMERLLETKERLRLSTVELAVHDACVREEALRETADVLLCDVPCSALGILSRKPEIKYRTRLQDMEALVVKQRQILDAVWPYVKEGGTLLYSTCTLHPEENERQVERFCADAPFTCEQMRQLFPGEADTDGFFFAVLRREAG